MAYLKKEKRHTEKMTFPRVVIYLQMIQYLSQEETMSLMEEAVRIGVEPDRKRLHHITQIPFVRPLFFKIFPKMMDSMFNEEAGFKTKEYQLDNRYYRVDVLQCPYMKSCKLLGCEELTSTFCLSDDRVYGNLCDITFEREGTIGRGHEKCDFYFIETQNKSKLGD